MTTPVWPASLPAFVREDGFSESLPDQTVESAVDTGPPKVRRRYTKNFRVAQAIIWCDAEQAAAFESFWAVTLSGGVTPFLWVNPITQSPALMRFKRPPPVKSSFGGVNVAFRFSYLQIAQYATLAFDSTEVTFDSTEVTFDQDHSY